MIPAPDYAARPGKKKLKTFGRTRAHKGCNLIADTPLLQPGLTIAADSCSLIFLNTLGILEAYASVHSIVLTRSLYEEITHKPVKENIADDQSLYKKLFETGVLSIHAAASPVQRRGGLSVADCSLLHAWETLKPDGILTDDKNLCRYCLKHAIPYINTPMSVFVLLYNGRLAHDQYAASLQTLYGIGRYGQFVRDHMEKLYAVYCACENDLQ
jgi:hypothetical protein